ncbi:MAG: PAS domain S-box protein [Hydrogenophaga sp.]|uniref:sensor histidine kinase n=1 Tax=Hydrogenophaga sp. TaxID=1904254 RepID=UPI00257D6D2C|nr:sensor histidine kinase [Hydrogenophaga sp.]MBL0942695.1 PAS domain S-box protein [Hydrogenophaga sp.]
MKAWRARLPVLLVLALTALAAALLWWQTGRAQAQLQEQLRAAAGQRSLHLADAVAGQVESLIALADGQLQTARREWLRDPADVERAARVLIEGVPRRMVTHLSVADAQGRIVFHTTERGPPTRIDEQPYFQALSDGRDRLFIGQPQRSRLNGGWTVTAARPLLRNGRFEGTVQVGLSTDFLARRLGSVALSPLDVIALVGPDGTFFARSRDNEAAMGKRLPADRPFLSTALPLRDEGTFRMNGYMDGTPRLYGWSRLREHGLVVSVGLADEGVLAPLAPAVARARELTSALTALLLLGGLGMVLLLRRLARSEARTQAARALRNRLFDSSQVPMGVIDPATMCLIECNDAAVRAYRLGGREQTLGTHVSAMSAPQQRNGVESTEAAQAHMAQAMERGMAVFEWLHQRSDGQRWDAEVHLMRFESEGRTLLQFTVIDITARRRVEERLQASETRLKEAQRIASIGNWERDLRSGQLSWSDEIYRILELDPAKHRPSFRTFLSRVHADDQTLVAEAYRAVADTRELQGMVHRLCMPDGRIKHVRETALTEFDGEQAVRSVGTVQDITAVREAEEALRRLNEELEDRVAARTRELSQLNRELESFAYSVSHDLRTPLRGINGFASLLAEEHGERLGAEAREHLERIRQSASGMGQLIDALLALARVNRGELQPAWVDISALARTLAAELRAGEPQRASDWFIEDGLRAWGDPALLRSVMQNLLGNAWKYTRQAPVARIRVERLDTGGNETAFTVSDNGAGFDMRYAGQLFEPFKRLHSPKTFEGTGVGLATVQRVLERHGGWIRGEGEPGQGARFGFGLPLP